MTASPPIMANGTEVHPPKLDPANAMCGSRRSASRPPHEREDHDASGAGVSLADQVATRRDPPERSLAASCT